MHKEKELLVLQYVSKKSTRLKHKIIYSYQPLVSYIAKKFAYNYEDIPDLVQVGSIGLLKSLDTFEPKKEIAFSTFASSNIIGEIKHYLRDNIRLVKLPRRLQEDYTRIRCYIKETSSKSQKNPTPKEIAAALNLKLDRVLESLEAGQSRFIVSLDKPMYAAENQQSTSASISLLDNLGIEPAHDKLLNKDILESALNTLETRQKQCIQLRFYEGMKQWEISERLNISQMHVSRLLKTAIKKLKDVLITKL